MTTPNDATWWALQRMVDDGSDLDRPMTIDFFVAVPDEASGRAVAKGAGAKGFETSVECDEESAMWTCYCTKVIVPAYEAVVAIEAELDALGRAVGGHADGFGSSGNAREAVRT